MNGWKAFNMMTAEPITSFDVTLASRTMCGGVEIAILRNENCVLLDRFHHFGMVDHVEVERDTNLALHLTCGCVIGLDMPLGGVIEVRK